MASRDNQPPPDLTSDPLARRRVLSHRPPDGGLVVVVVDHRPAVAPQVAIPQDRWDEGTVDLVARAVGWIMDGADQTAIEADPPGGRGPTPTV